MKKLALFVIAVSFVCSAIAEPTPFSYKKLLEEKNKVEFKYGEISLQAWKAWKDFPHMSEITIMEKSKRKHKNAVDFMQGKATLGVRSDKINIFTQGKIPKAGADYDWAPILVFTPKNTGTLKIAGKLTITAKETDKPVVQWAVVKINIKDKKMTAIAEVKGAKKGDVIDLAEKVGTVTLKNGEALGITAWRTKFHWWGGVNLQEFTISK